MMNTTNEICNFISEQIGNGIVELHTPDLPENCVAVGVIKAVFNNIVFVDKMSVYNTNICRSVDFKDWALIRYDSIMPATTEEIKFREFYIC